MKNKINAKKWFKLGVMFAQIFKDIDDNPKIINWGFEHVWNIIENNHEKINELKRDKK
jgi:hypothetical protein